MPAALDSRARPSSARIRRLVSELAPGSRWISGRAPNISTSSDSADQGRRREHSLQGHRNLYHTCFSPHPSLPLSPPSLSTPPPATLKLKRLRSAKPGSAQRTVGGRLAASPHSPLTAVRAPPHGPTTAHSLGSHSENTKPCWISRAARYSPIPSLTLRVQGAHTQAQPAPMGGLPDALFKAPPCPLSLHPPSQTSPPPLIW